jgi:hypothetical protein
MFFQINRWAKQHNYSNCLDAAHDATTRSQLNKKVVKVNTVSANVNQNLIF